MTTPKLMCLVPFCRRFTHSTKWSEWMCADHYRLVDRRLKRLRSRIQRRSSELMSGEDYRQGRVHLRLLRAPAVDDLIWKRMKRQALERALP